MGHFSICQKGDLPCPGTMQRLKRWLCRGKQSSTAAVGTAHVTTPLRKGVQVIPANALALPTSANMWMSPLAVSSSGVLVQVCPGEICIAYCPVVTVSTDHVVDHSGFTPWVRYSVHGWQYMPLHQPALLTLSFAVSPRPLGPHDTNDANTTVTLTATVVVMAAPAYALCFSDMRCVFYTGSHVYVQVQMDLDNSIIVGHDCGIVAVIGSVGNHRVVKMYNVRPCGLRGTHRGATSAVMLQVFAMGEHRLPSGCGLPVSAAWDATGSTLYCVCERLEGIVSMSWRSKSSRVVCPRTFNGLQAVRQSDVTLTTCSEGVLISCPFGVWLWDTSTAHTSHCMWASAIKILSTNAKTCHAVSMSGYLVLQQVSSGRGLRDASTLEVALPAARHTVMLMGRPRRQWLVLLSSSA